MESVAFVYNGSNECVATITDAVIARTYRFSCDDPDSGSVTDTAVSTTLVLTISDIGGLSAGERFQATTRKSGAGGEYYGATIFSFADTAEFAYDAVWDYDGALTVDVLFTGDIGESYYTQISPQGEFSSTDAGTGSPQVITNVSGVSLGTGRFLASLTEQSTQQDLSCRLFDGAQANDGYLGNPRFPTPEIVTQYQRIYGWRLNISDDALETVDPMLTSPQTGIS